MRKVILISVATLTLFAVGCASHDAHVTQRDHRQGAPSPGVMHGGPPAHAPAHGYRRKFQYRYYADHRVYHAVDRGMYFWLEGEDWRFGVELPSHIVLETPHGVIVELDADEPYEHYAALKAHPDHRHHPGKGKANGHRKTKAKGRGR